MSRNHQPQSATSQESAEQSIKLDAQNSIPASQLTITNLASSQNKEGKKMQSAEELARAFVDNESEENDSETPTESAESPTATAKINDADGDVSVTKADKAKDKVDEDAKKQMSFTAGPKFQDALDAQLDAFNRQLLETNPNAQPTKMSALLRNIVARSIGFDLTLDPVKHRSKYASDEERKAAIKASQEKTRDEKKKLNSLIKMAKDKNTRAQAIAALMESLGITDDDVE